MKKRTGVDFIISGGLWWTDKSGISHSLNLLIDEYQQIRAGTYSKFGFRTFRDKNFEIDWYKWDKDLKDMLGGSPSLIISGKIDIRNEAVKGRHPRAGIGLNKDYFFMVTVDGRQKDKTGATNQEFAEIMKDLGCENAIGGDGGGTVRLEDKNGAINSPTENRAMNNAIGVKLKEAK